MLARKDGPIGSRLTVYLAGSPICLCPFSTPHLSLAKLLSALLHLPGELELGFGVNVLGTDIAAFEAESVGDLGGPVFVICVG
jgi:hypothetical protein